MFDFLSFLRDYCPTPDDVVALVGEHFDETPEREAVRKWFSRKSVPSEWLIVLLLCVEKRTGKPVKLANYIIEGQGDVNIFD